MSSSTISSSAHNKIIKGIDATGDDNIIGDSKDQWKDGHVFTFWAYNYNYPGTKQYHIYYTQNNYIGLTNETQRFTLSTFDLTKEKEKKGWHLQTSFWAFEDKRVKAFTGNINRARTKKQLYI